ncbi:MAG: glycosyltransferase family 2 protein [Bdellovibrionales bacterium]|nr:glycosyltransferase family 2 protein [Bdellovibrionales bacterium]
MKDSHKRKNLVDIIIPTFNRSSTLDRAIQSVFNQEFKEYILWVVDDGSTDNSLMVLKKWQPLFPAQKMQIIQLHKNKGVSIARNTGIRAGKAPWLAFLDSDDEWMEQKLQQQIKWTTEHPQYPLIHTEELWIRKTTPNLYRNKSFQNFSFLYKKKEPTEKPIPYESGEGAAGIKIDLYKRVNQKKKHQKKGGRVFIDNLDMCRISPSSVIVKRAFLNKIGLFREDFPVCEDYELWLRVSSQTEVGFIKKPLIIKYGGHSNQLSQKYKAMDEWRVRAMASHLDNPSISKEEKQKLIDILNKKCQILLNGYKKHNNYKNTEEIKQIYNLTI